MAYVVDCCVTCRRNQNITVGVSFGSTRELFFLHAKSGMRIYFPQVRRRLPLAGAHACLQPAGMSSGNSPARDATPCFKETGCPS